MQTLNLFGEYSRTATGKEKESARHKEYYRINKSEKNRKHIEWQRANREKVLEYNRNRNKERREAWLHLCELKMIGAEWANEIRLEEKAKRKEIAKQRAKQYKKEYRKTSPIEKAGRRRRTKSREDRRPEVRMKSAIAKAIQCHIKKGGYTKKSTTQNILGIDFMGFKQHLESKFELWMNWDNYGMYKVGEINYGWDIDHIIPMTTAKTEEDVIRLSHYTNLQPMCSYTNRHVKSDRIIKKRK